MKSESLRVFRMQGPLNHVARYFHETAQSVTADVEQVLVHARPAKLAGPDPDHDRTDAGLHPCGVGARAQ